MKYLLVSILCLLGLSVNGQITQRNIEIVKTDNNSDVFGINNIDSITYEYDEILDSYTQKNWIKGECFNYPIHQVASVDFVDHPVRLTTDLNVENSVASVITTNGDFAYTIKDSVNNDGFFSVFGNVESKDYLYVKLDTCAYVRAIWSNAYHYVIDYYQDSIHIIKIDSADKDIFTIYKSDYAKLCTHTTEDIYYSKWAKFCNMVNNILKEGGIDVESDSYSKPVRHIGCVTDSIILDTQDKIFPLAKVAIRNRTFLGDMLYLYDVSQHILDLCKENWLAIRDLLNDIDEGKRRWHRFQHLGWWDVTTLSAEDVTASSAKLPCEIIGINPLGGWLSIANCTMSIYKENTSIPVSEQTKDISQKGKVSFGFHGLTPETKYIYKPILIAYYYENIGGAMDVSVHDIFVGNNIKPVQTILHKEAQIDGVEMSFVTSGPVAVTGSASNITEKSASVECSFSNVPKGAECGVLLSWNDGQMTIPASSSEGEQAINITVLKANTIYNYNAYIKYNDKYYNGNVESFTTNPPDISGTWICVETYYINGNYSNPQYRTYTVVLNKNGKAEVNNGDDFSSWEAFDGWSWGLYGNTLQMQCTIIATQTQNSGQKIKGTVDNLNDPKKITGRRFNWNFNQYGSFESDGWEIVMTR